MQRAPSAPPAGAASSRSALKPIVFAAGEESRAAEPRKFALPSLMARSSSAAAMGAARPQTTAPAGTTAATASGSATTTLAVEATGGEAVLMSMSKGFAFVMSPSMRLRRDEATRTFPEARRAPSERPSRAAPWPATAAACMAAAGMAGGRQSATAVTATGFLPGGAACRAASFDASLATRGTFTAAAGVPSTHPLPASLAHPPWPQAEPQAVRSAPVLQAALLPTPCRCGSWFLQDAAYCQMCGVVRPVPQAGVTVGVAPSWLTRAHSRQSQQSQSPSPPPQGRSQPLARAWRQEITPRRRRLQPEAMVRVTPTAPFVPIRREVHRQIVVEKIVEKIVEVPVYIDRPFVVEKVVEKIVDRPTIQTVEVHVDRLVYIERPADMRTPPPLSPPLPRRSSSKDEVAPTVVTLPPTPLMPMRTMRTDAICGEGGDLQPVPMPRPLLRAQLTSAVTARWAPASKVAANAFISPPTSVLNSLANSAAVSAAASCVGSRASLAAPASPRMQLRRSSSLSLVVREEAACQTGGNSSIDDDEVRSWCPSPRSVSPSTSPACSRPILWASETSPPPRVQVRVTLDRQRGHRLGVAVEERDEGLLITEVLGGLVVEWNREQSDLDLQIAVGDLIVEVNGLCGDGTAILERLQENQVLDIRLVKEMVTSPGSRRKALESPAVDVFRASAGELLRGMNVTSMVDEELTSEETLRVRAHEQPQKRAPEHKWLPGGLQYIMAPFRDGHSQAHVVEREREEDEHTTFEEEEDEEEEIEVTTAMQTGRSDLIEDGKAAYLAAIEAGRRAATKLSRACGGATGTAAALAAAQGEIGEEGVAARVAAAVGPCTLASTTASERSWLSLDSVAAAVPSSSFPGPAVPGPMSGFGELRLRAKAAATPATTGSAAGPQSRDLPGPRGRQASPMEQPPAVPRPSRNACGAAGGAAAEEAVPRRRREDEVEEVEPGEYRLNLVKTLHFLREGIRASMGAESTMGVASALASVSLPVGECTPPPMPLRMLRGESRPHSRDSQRAPSRESQRTPSSGAEGRQVAPASGASWSLSEDSLTSSRQTSTEAVQDPPRWGAGA